MTAQIHSFGCDKHQSDTYDECYACTIDEMSAMSATISVARQAFKSINRWIAMARAGELSSEAAFKQIEIDSGCCSPPAHGGDL